MALRREITARIIDLLQENPQGLSITEIVRHGGINRNTAGRYLDNLLVTGQVEMRHFGMAKIYSLSHRLPVSSVLSISSELVMQLDASLRIVFMNQPFIHLLGTTSEKELTGKNIEFSRVPLYFDETFPTVLEWISSGLSGTEFRGELTVPVRKKIFSCRVAPTVFNNGQKGVSILFDDITLQKQGERLLRESEGRLRSIIHVAPIGIGLVINRTFLEINDKVCQMTGYTEEELIGRPVRILYPTQEEYDRVGDVKYRQMQRTGAGSIETTWLRKDGQTIDVLLSSTPLNHEHPEAGITFTALDITERKRGERALRESEEKFRALFNNADDMMTLNVLSEDRLHRHYIEVNDAACRKLKYTRQELLALVPEDLVALESLALVRGIAQQLLEDGHVTFEAVLLTKDREQLPVEINAHLFDFKGKQVALAIIRDITERKRIEAALRGSEARYRSLAEASQDIIFVIDRDDRVLYINQTAADFLGRPAADIIGQPRSANFPPEVSQRQYGALQHVFATGQPLRNEGPMTVKNETRWYDHALVPIPDPDGGVASVLGVSRDITRRIAAERERLQNEQTNRFIAEHCVDIIHRLSPDCICTYASPSITTLLGYAEEEVLGKPVLGMIHPDDLPGVLTDIARIRDSGEETVTSTFRFRHKDGRYVLFESTTRIVRDATGKVKEFLNISRDVSKRTTVQ